MYHERGIADKLKISLANPDFIIVNNIQGKYDSSYNDMRQILNKINLGGFIIEYKC
ncbi:MAG: hypothetical protein PHX40_01920 [Bacilli bacterium]|nr:hypothetical protein [Bacilli bacterium]